MGVVGIANILISLSGLIFIPIITKSFSTGDYGVWAQVNTFVSLVPNFVNLGLPYTMVRFLAAEKDKDIIKQSFYSMMLLVLASTLIMSVVFLTFSSQIASALFDGSLQIMYIVIIMSFFACLDLMLLSYFRTIRIAIATNTKKNPKKRPRTTTSIGWCIQVKMMLNTTPIYVCNTKNVEYRTIC